MAEQVVFASQARTATPTAAQLATRRYKTLTLVIDITAVTSTPSTTFNINRVDSTSGKKVLILASAAQAAVATITMRVGVGLPVTANVSANEALPSTVEVTAVHGNANSMTYSVSAHWA